MMKSYLEFVPISARMHRRRNRMTLLCIILAVFLAATIFSLADMELRIQEVRAIQTYGNWHINLQDLNEEQAERIALRPDVAAFSRYNVVNYRLENDYSMGGKRVAVCGVEGDFLEEIMTNQLTEGHFPTEPNQAVLTENSKKILGAEIGDTVPLHLPSGDTVNITISGFGMDTLKSAQRDAIIVITSVNQFQEIYAAVNHNASDSSFTYYLQFQDHVNIRKSIEDIQEQFNLADEQIHENVALLGVMGFSNDSYMMGLYGVAAVLFLLVTLAGVLMIAGSMNSSIMQRTAFFGMLRCIGADTKQIKHLVRLEALAWCRVAIPIGIIIGIIITWLACALLQALIPGYFAEMPMFAISPIGILMGAAVGLLTVLIAAQSPAKKAAKVSPLTAVSGNAWNTGKINKAANTKTMKIHTALGIHHAKQNKKGLVLMVSSFAISIVLFLAFSPMLDFMNHAIKSIQPYTADLSIISADNTCSIPKNFIAKTAALEGVKKVYGRQFAYDIPAKVNGNDTKVMLISYEDNQFGWVEQEKWASDKRGLAQVYQDQNQGYVMAVYSPQSAVKKGDVISTDLSDLTITTMLEQCPFDGGANTIVLVCSESLFRHLTGETDYTIIDIQLEANAPQSTTDAIQQLAGVDYIFSNQSISNQDAIGAYYSFGIFFYGFLLIIALISVFNIINSIALSITSRQKQYGAMRAVGMSMQQIKKMIYAEAYTYAAFGILTGLVIGLPLHYLLWQFLIFNRWNDPWQIPISACVIILVLVLLSCFAAVHSPAKRIEKTPIVQVINDD